MGCVPNRPEPHPPVKVDPKQQPEPVKMSNVSGNKDPSNVYPSLPVNAPAKPNESGLRPNTVNSSKMIQQIGLRSQVRKTTGSVITENRSQAKYIFGASDMNSKPFSDQQAFIAAKSFTIDDTVVITRPSDYSTEVNNKIVMPNLLVKKQLLTYDIDTEDGVSKTPIVHTFQYHSKLNHHINLAWNPQP